MTNQYTSVDVRFANSWMPEPNSGCWLWTGAASAANKSKTDMRPTIHRGGKKMFAHRLSYELFVGQIPSGAMICHHCDTPLCVNPSHLYAGDHQTNARDSVLRHRHNSQTDPDAAKERGRRLGRDNTGSHVAIKQAEDRK